MKTHFHVFLLIYQYFENFLMEHFLKLNLLQLSHSMFCKNFANLAVAGGCHTWIRSLAMGKRAIFLQNILRESYSKFDFNQCSLVKSLKILIFWRKYMKMCFHSNRPSWGINHFFVSLCFKNQSPCFISFPIILAPVISSLDEIYCAKYKYLIY